MSSRCFGEMQFCDLSCLCLSCDLTHFFPFILRNLMIESGPVMSRPFATRIWTLIAFLTFRPKLSINSETSLSLHLLSKSDVKCLLPRLKYLIYSEDLANISSFKQCQKCPNSHMTIIAWSECWPGLAGMRSAAWWVGTCHQGDHFTPKYFNASGHIFRINFRVSPTRQRLISGRNKEGQRGLESSPGLVNAWQEKYNPGEIVINNN